MSEALDKAKEEIDKIMTSDDDEETEEKEEDGEDE